MSSKNNPLNRNRNANVKTIGGKVIKPCRYISEEDGDYMAAMYEDGKMVLDPRTGVPIKYASA